ncbi:hypothetical protein BVRB_6g141140 [Beta vulgaris subsp. vulgaris]|nr:hypothetical protein BVRB_6g141140 [Beta vulgaris subsp. vulgaris]
MDDDARPSNNSERLLTSNESFYLFFSLFLIFHV